MKAPYSIIIEISMFSGRTLETKKKLYQTIVNTLSDKMKIAKKEIFIVVSEQPKENWGVRGGIAACDLDIGFKIEV